MTTPTRSQVIAADVDALLRARNPLLWIITREEARVERYLIEAASAAGYVPRTWDVAAGFCDIGGNAEVIDRRSGEEYRDPGEALNAIRDRARSESNKERGAWIMRDLPTWLTGPAGATTLRQVRNLARTLPGVARENAQALIVITPSGEVPAELAGHTTVIDWPLPDRAEIAAMLDAALDAVAGKIEQPMNGERDAAIDAALGLSGEEASACYARSLVQLRSIDAKLIAQEKKRVIARERVLEWFDPLPGGLEAVGGLDLLKSWLMARRSAYSAKARDYGLPPPKGTLLVGVPGCGKTLTAKAVATAYGVPLLRLDLGALKSKFVGESEGNLRKALSVIEAIGRCVVWLDEVEKALQGATSGSADGGVSSDALGAILSWMQDRQGEAFIVATANDASALPPELLRKGRFDEIFFVDLPTPSERVSVLSAALRSHGRDKAKIDLKKVAASCADFTGSEIAALVPEALFLAFADKAREITTDDLIEAASTVVPLAKTAEKKIESLREWAKSRARPATKREVELVSDAKRPARRIDL